MAAKDIHMDVEGNVLENIYVREDTHCDASTPEPKAKKDKKQLRKRSTSRGGGGGGIFKTIRSKSYTHFDPDEYSTKNDSKLVLKCSVEMTMNSLTKSRFLFLYEDALIITKQKSSTIFHFKSQVDLRDIWLKDDYQDSVDADSGTSSKATAYRLGWPIATVDLDFPTVEEKHLWVEKLQTLLAIVRNKEDTSVIIRLAKNDEEFSVTKKCLVGKTESVRNVLARCAELFHSKSDSRENEFQLQALTSRPSNEDPIPLTGSEILYRIQTKYNREHGDGRKDTAAEDNAEFAGDELVFRVISLEKKAADDQHKAANGTALARFFRQSHEGFFRRNLSELYKDGKLCWLLMRMLSHLYVNGPSSEQIFRRPPAKKQQNLLQEKLEHGKVNFDKVDACDMSQLLKTFLNLLPECLLTTELYDEWFEVPKQNDRTAMISLAKSLVGRLPECNLVLLRHLICVLRRISSESVVNKMPPKSLSICIGQCLLWLPVNATAPVEMNNQIYKIEIVNRVTEVLIDNALDIFGGECFHLFDHLHEQPLSSSTNEIKETFDVIGSMETENATDMKTEPVLATSSPDHQEDITMYSVFPFDRYSADGANDEEEMGLLHEVTQAMALRRLNGPSLLLLPGALQEPLPSNLPPFGCQETGTDLDLSHRSSPTNLFPEKQSVTDDNNNKEEEEEEEEKEKEEERSVRIENSLEFCTSSNQLRAEEDVFHVDASPPTRENSHSFLAKDSLSTTAIISAAEPCTSSDEIALPSDDDDNQQYSDDVESKSSAAESILPSFLSGPPSQGSTSVVPVGCLDMESCTPIPILVCPETAETSDAAVEVAVGLKEQSKKMTEITLDEPSQSSSSSSSSSSAAAVQSATTESMKSHLPIIVVPSLTSQSVGSSPVIRKAMERNEISTIESKTKFPGRRIAPSPDEGYSTSSIKTSRGGGGGGGARRDSEMAPSRIDKRFSPYPENTSPSKLSLQRSAFQTTGRAANSASSDSGLRNETPAAAARSPPCVAIDRPVTPVGIVRRLTSQIEEREHRLQGPLSPNFKGASGSLTVSPSSVSVRTVHSDDGASPSTASSEHSKFQQHSSRRSSRRREFPSNLQKIDAVKSRPAVPVSPSENLHKPITFFGACSRGRAAASQNLLTVANKEERRQNPEETDKPATEQIISLSRRRKDPVANVSLTNTKPEDSSPPDAKERTSDKDSQKPSREDEQPLRHSDPKMTPRQARERRRSDIGVAEMRTRNKENKENTPGRCCQLQKRPSPTTTELISSTREKVSRISTELDDEMIGKLEEETSPAMTTTKSETMSVKNREWHRQLTEQYSTAAAAAAAVSGGAAAAAAAAAAATSVTTGCSASRRPQRSVPQLACKISYTPAPLRVFHHGTERSRATACTSAAAKKS